MENILLRESKEIFEERKSLMFSESFNQIFNKDYKTQLKELKQKHDQDDDNYSQDEFESDRASLNQTSNFNTGPINDEIDLI